MSKKKQISLADDKLQVVLNRLKSEKGRVNAAFDTETSGLDWRYQHIVGYVFSFGPNPDESYYIPFRHLGSENVGGQSGPQTKDGWDGKLAKGEKELLKAALQPDNRYVGHNLAFDLKFLYRVAGTDAFIPQFEDTIINAPLINEHAGKFSLEACCVRAGVQAKKSEMIASYLMSKFPEIKSPREAMGWFWRLGANDPMAIEYAEGDGTSTWQLRDAQMKEIGAQDLIRVHDVESRLIRVLARMTCKGIRVDTEKAKALYGKLDTDINILMEMLPPGASVRSSDDIKAWMEKNGHDSDWPMTPITKKPSFTEDYLSKHEAGRKIIHIRQMTHLRDSFVGPLLETHIWNGRVHANFNQMRGDEYGTITGRLSCDSPNLQQAHKRDAVRGRMLRGLFLPDEGKIFAEVDYSQCEPRLLAYYSRSKVLLEGYRANPSVDAHTAVTKAINSSTWDTLDDKQKKALRENGKRVNQTLVTGGGKGVIVHKYGVDPKEVDKIWNDYFKAMPEIKWLQTKAGASMRAKGYVFSLLGRRSRLLDLGKSYIAVNRLLQCGNADILKSKLVEMDSYLEKQGRPEIDILNNIHDAMDFQFDEGSRKHYNKLLQIMTSFGPDDLIPLDVPMEVDAGEGKTWAEATFGEEKGA